MAKSKQEKKLARKLRAGGLRKRSAKVMAGASDGRRKPTKKVQRVVDGLGKVLSDHEDRVKGGQRKAAAKRAAKTRKQNAASRSKAAKKGARTRAKSRT